MVTPAPDAQWAEGRRAGRRSGGRQLFSEAEKWDELFMLPRPWSPGDAPRDPRVPLMDSGSWTPRPQVRPQVGPPASPVPASLLVSPLEILSSAPALSAPSLCCCGPSGQVLQVPGRLPRPWDVASCVLGSVTEVTLTVRTSIAWPSLSTCPLSPPAPPGLLPGQAHPVSSVPQMWAVNRESPFCLPGLPQHLLRICWSPLLPMCPRADHVPRAPLCPPRAWTPGSDLTHRAELSSGSSPHVLGPMG